MNVLRCDMCETEVTVSHGRRLEIPVGWFVLARVNQLPAARPNWLYDQPQPEPELYRRLVLCQPNCLVAAAGLLAAETQGSDA